jgi:hypothetical protein
MREADRAKKAKDEKDRADRLAAEKKALEDEVAKVAEDITKCEAAWKLIEESVQMTGIGKTVADMDAIGTEISSKYSFNVILYKSKIANLNAYLTAKLTVNLLDPFKSVLQTLEQKIKQILDDIKVAHTAIKSSDTNILLKKSEITILISKINSNIVIHPLWNRQEL